MKLERGPGNRPFDVMGSDMELCNFARSDGQGEKVDTSNCGHVGFPSYAEAQGGPEFFALVESIREG
jgi:hypothetical protein